MSEIAQTDLQNGTQTKVINSTSAIENYYNTRYHISLTIKCITRSMAIYDIERTNVRTNCNAHTDTTKSRVTTTNN